SATRSGPSSKGRGRQSSSCSRSDAFPRTPSHRHCATPASKSRRPVTASRPGRSRRRSSKGRSRQDAPALGSPPNPDRTVKQRDPEVPVIVPELPSDIRDLKAALGRFIETEVYPLEQRIAERGSIDAAEVDELRRRAREAGFSMLNMPAEHGGRELSMLGQVALEEESGKATNGLGFAVVDRGPRELLEIATPEQAERWIAPIIRGEYREAWAVTEPGAGSDVAGIRATATRDGDDWLIDGEKWFVTSEADPGFYIVLALAGGEQTLFLVEPNAPGLEIVRTPGFLHDPYLDHHPEIVFRGCRVPDANRIPEGGGEGAKEWFTVERLFIAARCCGPAERLLGLAPAYAQ